MRDGVALQRYLSRHLEPDLPHWGGQRERWNQAVVVPAYRECASLLHALSEVPATSGRTLVILVLNRPDSDPDRSANTELRAACEAQPAVDSGAGIPIVQVNALTDIYLHDLEARRGPIPASRGVGLARKTGCDIALAGIAAGVIDSQWICCTDADARLPSGYFERLHSAREDAVAAVFPFRHDPADDPAITRATLLYELRLHHYVLGLEWAGSPYAYHALGSCLAVRPGAYAHVRGIPRRSGAEDFYLLNKLAKLGPVARLRGECIRLRSRASRRVPFGTGPAVAAIASNAAPDDLPLFYHPQIFAALRVVLSALPEPGAGKLDLEAALAAGGLPGDLVRCAVDALETLGVEEALDHCRRQGRTPGGFRRHFHQWFDALRTLRFCHALRDAGWNHLSLSGLRACAPESWPMGNGDQVDPEALLRALRAQREWV